MARSGGCGMCKVCKGSPIVRASTSSQYRRGLCRNQEMPPFATKKGYCLLPDGGAGRDPDSFLALDVTHNIEAKGNTASLWGMTRDICVGLKRKPWHTYLAQRGLSHKQATRNIVAHTSKRPDESWAEWALRLIQGGV